MVILIPMIKVLESHMNTQYFQLCPWDQPYTDMRSQRKINSISLYTFINMIMIFTSRGWFSKTHSITTCKIVKYFFIMLIIDVF